MLALKGRQILTLSRFISDLRIPNNLEMNLINSEFASPSTGAAAIWIPIPSLEISAEVKYKKKIKLTFFLFVAGIHLLDFQHKFKLSQYFTSSNLKC